MYEGAMASQLGEPGVMQPNMTAWELSWLYHSAAMGCLGNIPAAAGESSGTMAWGQTEVIASAYARDMLAPWTLLAASAQEVQHEVSELAQAPYIVSDIPPLLPSPPLFSALGGAVVALPPGLNMPSKMPSTPTATVVPSTWPTLPPSTVSDADNQSTDEFYGLLGQRHQRLQHDLEDLAVVFRSVAAAARAKQHHACGKVALVTYNANSAEASPEKVLPCGGPRTPDGVVAV